MKKNTKAAFRWYQKSSDQGYQPATYNLGRMHYLGRGTPKNVAKAVECWRSLANKGYAAAMYDMGLLYEAGDGVPKNKNEASNWFKKALAKKEPRAIKRFGSPK
jgi:TPR repeat protein